MPFYNNNKLKTLFKRFVHLMYISLFIQTAFVYFCKIKLNRFITTDNDMLEQFMYIQRLLVYY